MATARVLVIVRPAFFPILEDFCRAREMDVVTLEINGLPGYGFFKTEESQTVFNFLVEMIDQVFLVCTYRNFVTLQSDFIAF